MWGSKLFCIGATATLTAIIATAATNTLYDHVLPAARQKVSCMIGVLKSTPGYEQAGYGAEKGPDGAIRPYVQYRYVAPGTGQHAQVRFTEGTQAALPYDSTDTTYVFSATLPGLIGAKQKEPFDLGAKKIGNLWKQRCGVNITIFFI